MNFQSVSIPFQSRFRQFLCTDASYYPELPKGKSVSILTKIKTEKKFMTMPPGPIYDTQECELLIQLIDDPSDCSFMMGAMQHRTPSPNTQSRASVKFRAAMLVLS